MNSLFSTNEQLQINKSYKMSKLFINDDNIADKDNPNIDVQLKYQEKQSRREVNASNFSIDTDLQSDMRNSLDTGSSLEATATFLNSAYAAEAAGKNVDKTYLTALEKNILTASNGTQYYSKSEGKIVDLPFEGSIANYNNSQLQAMNLNTEQQSAVANFQYIKNGSYQQRI
ncbi:hypothetical protein [Francisella philomiragia]|uniref:Uncharacterized protein n=1 Tax=Francisella philomiragia TaxID=28110 RepID=A0A0B6CRT5_9GAMM|nr:hypothetical protein [Francisella philomiragia]AJI53194.1 hypothetical protein LA55_1755 [Francisella philomiragia]